MVDQIIGLLMVGLGILNPWRGDVAGETTEIGQDRKEIRQDTQEIRQDKREIRSDVRNRNLKEAREDRSELREDRLERREDTRELREDRRQKLREERETFREEVRAKREKAKEEFQAQREAFKEKLQNIRDEKKKAIVERIDNRLSEVNTNRTGKMTEHLNKMSEILEKVVSRSATAKANGKDTSVVDAAVAEAQGAIDAARSAVSNQAGKEYIITISSEGRLGTDVSNARKLLESDLKATHSVVVTARKAVSGALRAFASALGELAPPAVTN